MKATTLLLIALLVYLAGEAALIYYAWSAGPEAQDLGHYELTCGAWVWVYD